MRGVIGELDGFFDARDERELPCVILGPGPSLHADLLPLFELADTIAVDEVAQIFTANIWLCSSPAHVLPIVRGLTVGDAETVARIRETCEGDVELCLLEVSDLPRASPLLLAVWIAAHAGARAVHLDGFDRAPDAMGRVFSPRLAAPHEHTPWDMMGVAESLAAAVQIFPELRIAVYDAGPRPRGARRVDPEIFWTRRRA